MFFYNSGIAEWMSQTNLSKHHRQIV